MLAIIETGGKQYEVAEGRYIDIELLEQNPEESVEFEKVVMVVAGEGSKVGQPYVEGATVKATVLKHDRDKKIIVYKQRCKKGYRKKQGHRQDFTRVMIDSIDFPEKAAVVAAEPKEEVKPAKKTTAKAKTETKKAAAKKPTAKKAAKPVETTEEAKTEE